MPSSQKTVVITGASSGIGRSCVSRMNRTGWQVFATVRKEADRDQLRSEFASNVYPVLMDVENESSIAAAAGEIESQIPGRGLDGFVNVAAHWHGAAARVRKHAGCSANIRSQLFWPVATIQAFAGLLRKQRGRIVNITTVGVNLALPFGGLLNASKSALARGGVPFVERWILASCHLSAAKDLCSPPAFSQQRGRQF